MIVFIHIPKTGGTSLTAFLENTYKKKVESFRFPRGDNQVDWEKVQLIHGHFPMDHPKIQECFPGRKLTYITLLRHPVERAVSYYYHSNPLVNGKQERSFDRWLCDHDGAEYMYSNCMTYYLSSYTRYEFPKEKPVHATFECYKSALDNLKNRIAYGFLDSIEDFMLLLENGLSLKDTVTDIRLNVNENRALYENTPGEILNYFRAKNNYDLHLWNEVLG